MTGRTSAFAREIVGVDGLRYVGQHGLELEPAAAAFAERIHAFARGDRLARPGAEAADGGVPLPAR